MRKIAKTDCNHAEITHQLQDAGFSVVTLHQVGHGVPDLLVCGRKLPEGEYVNLLVEVKSSEKAAMTADESTFHAQWPGPVIVAVDVIDVLRYYGRVA